MSFSITFPEAQSDTAQDDESCEVVIDGELRQIRFHDYADIYAVPGLYEHLFRDVLNCRSPDVVCALLREQLDAGNHDPAAVTVLDLGAGNGMVGDSLTQLGCGTVVGVDILAEAAEAAHRDRPGVYAEYVVGDLTDPSAEVREALGRYRFGVMTTVAALGFGDIPPEAFAYAYEQLIPGGWLAFCIKDEFLDDDASGFAKLIAELREAGSLDVFAERRYQHRLGADGSPLHYVAMVGQKAND